MGCSNLSKLVSPELKYDMYIYENDNGEIENIDFSLEGETLPISNEEDKNTSYKYLASSQKSEIASLQKGELIIKDDTMALQDRRPISKTNLRDSRKRL